MAEHRERGIISLNCRAGAMLAPRTLAAMPPRTSTTPMAAALPTAFTEENLVVFVGIDLVASSTKDTGSFCP